MLVIVNPSASMIYERLRNLVVAALHGRYEVEAIDTQARGHATDLCREAAHEGYDVVVILRRRRDRQRGRQRPRRLARRR